MPSASKNLPSTRAPGTTVLTHVLPTSTKNKPRSWAEVLTGPAPPSAPTVLSRPNVRPVHDHLLPEIPILTLSEPLMALDRSITSPGSADLRQFSYNGLSSPPSVHTCWNIGKCGVDVYGYPLDGYPWRATYERVHTPRSEIQENTAPARIVYVRRPIEYDAISRLPSPVPRASNSATIGLLEDSGTKMDLRIPVPEKKAGHDSKPQPRAPRVKETSQQRSERRRRNGGRKRNETWVARHESYLAKKRLEER
ncbi:hypothetical protein DFP73DRAFT_591989 [Morchella snyderi]|nr:hypothetical protein DFP73DRAFT_591989 [Morchella snyderi]